ncbi:hypothetical protein MMC18_004578 [Xylographa bjoerkii]|nr:hypothetical protein [Xylographa bjoerkii]
MDAVAGAPSPYHGGTTSQVASPQPQTVLSSVCAGGACSKSDCLSKNPPQGGPTTTAGICTATTTTSHVASTTTAVCPPTATNVCVLPSGSSSSGYSNGQCVGGIKPPYVTCNDIQSDFYQNPFKCYKTYMFRQADAPATIPGGLRRLENLSEEREISKLIA